MHSIKNSIERQHILSLKSLSVASSFRGVVVMNSGSTGSLGYTCPFEESCNDPVRIQRNLLGVKCPNYWECEIYVQEHVGIKLHRTHREYRGSPNIPETLDKS